MKGQPLDHVTVLQSDKYLLCIFNFEVIQPVLVKVIVKVCIIIVIAIGRIVILEHDGLASQNVQK